MCFRIFKKNFSLWKQKKKKEIETPVHSLQPPVCSVSATRFCSLLHHPRKLVLLISTSTARLFVCQLTVTPRTASEHLNFANPQVLRSHLRRLSLKVSSLYLKSLPFCSPLWAPCWGISGTEAVCSKSPTVSTNKCSQLLGQVLSLTLRWVSAVFWLNLGRLSDSVTSLHDSCIQGKITSQSFSQSLSHGLWVH
jgi:hypothetical protein